MTGDLKKGKYVYCRCTGYKGRCGEPYVAEPVLAKKFLELLRQFDIGDAALRLASNGLKSSQGTRRSHQAAARRI